MIRTALLFSLTIAVVVVPALPALGQETILIGPDTPDGEPCEPKSPQAVPCNPAAAMKIAVPGSRLELLGGVYSCLDVAGLHGAPGLPILFTPAAGASVTFACGDAGAPATVAIRDSSNLIFRGFAISNAAGRPFVSVTNSPAVSFEECTYGDTNSWSVSPPAGKP